MSREPLPGIGTCPCPVKGCDKVGTVKRKRDGKLMVHCPVHGNWMEGRKASQDWILANAKLDTPLSSPAPSKPASEPPPAPSKPASEPPPSDDDGSGSKWR